MSFISYSALRVSNGRMATSMRCGDRESEPTARIVSGDRNSSLLSPLDERNLNVGVHTPTRLGNYDGSLFNQDSGVGYCPRS